MDYQEFAGKIKAKYPQYADMADRDLAQKMVAKFPQYRDISFDSAQPTDPMEMAASQLPGLRPTGDTTVGRALSAAGETLGFPTSLQPLEIAKGLLMAPAKIGQTFNEVAGAGGQNVGEFAQGKGMSPTDAELLGGGVALAINPLSYAVPSMGEQTVFRPKVPLERAAEVAAAKEYGPLTRAQQTGGAFAANLESGLEKTPLGAGPINEARATFAKGLEAGKQGLQQQLGTSQDFYSVGQKAQSGIESRTKAMNAKRNDLFSAVPDNVNIPLQKSVDMADTLIQEQSQFLPTTRNSDIISLASDVQNAAKAVSEGQPNYPLLKRLREVLNARIDANSQGGMAGQSNQVARDYIRLKAALDGDIADFTSSGNASKVMGGSKTGDPHALFAYKDQFGPGGSERSVYNVFGDPNHPAIKKVGWGSSVPEDMLKAANIPITGQQAMLGDIAKTEFSKSYRKANAFSGAYSNLFKSENAQALLNAPPEKVVDMVFKKNNETAIKQFRALAGEDGFLPSKQKFTQDILDSPNVLKELDKYETGTLSAIYSHPELSQLKKFGMAQKVGNSVQNLQGTSGSARTNVSAAQYGGLFTGAGALATGHPYVGLAGLAQFVAPRLAAKAYLGTTEGIPVGGVARTGLTLANLGQEAAFNQRRKRKQ